MVRINRYSCSLRPMEKSMEEGFKVAPNANISDGKLEIILCKRVSLFKRMYFLPLVKLGRHLHKSAIEYQQLEEITIAF